MECRDIYSWYGLPRVLPLGLVADKVLEVVTVSASQIEPAPDVGIPWKSDYIAGVVRREGAFVVLFDLPKLLMTADTALQSSVMAA